MKSTMRVCSLSVLAALLVTAVCPLEATGQRAARQSGPLITVAMKTSRSQPTAGTGLGVMADVTNVSDETIFLHQKHFALILPPELEGPGKWSYGRYGSFPTEPGVEGDAWEAHLSLKPGDSYRVFWTKSYGPTEGGKESSFFQNVLRQIHDESTFLFFSPGEYTITVDAKYWTDPSFPPTGYRTIVQSMNLQVASPQSVVLIGAAVGGLVAYFFLPRGRPKLARRRSTGKRIVGRILIEVVGIVGAILFSGLFTILLSRLSDTQFLIRVTVVDVWGGVAMGFVANYFGVRVVDAALRKVSGNEVPAEAQGDKVF